MAADQELIFVFDAPKPTQVVVYPCLDWARESLASLDVLGDGHEPALAPGLAAFLDAGPPPIVFTLGSAAVFDPGRFYEESVRAASIVGRRAVLLVGPFAERLALARQDIGVFDYAPFSRLFPRAEVVVHQGGSGTTGQALRAGRPMVIVPYGHDQPDNAMRVSKLGISGTIGRQQYTADRVADALHRLIDDADVKTRAERVGETVKHEDGAAAAAAAIDRVFNR